MTEAEQAFFDAARVQANARSATVREHLQPWYMPTENSQDQQLKCIDCQHDFVFTKGEQAFFAKRNFTPPKRCKPCRDAKKQDKQTRQDGDGGAGNGGNGGGVGYNDANASFWAEGNRGGGKRDYERKRRR